MPISIADGCSATAVSGNATPPTPLPICDTTPADQNVRNWRSRRTLVTPLILTGAAAAARVLRVASYEGQQLRLDVGVIRHGHPRPVVAALPERLVHRQHALEHRRALVPVERLVLSCGARQ